MGKLAQVADGLRPARFSATWECINFSLEVCEEISNRLFAAHGSRSPHPQSSLLIATSSDYVELWEGARTWMVQ